MWCECSVANLGVCFRNLRLFKTILGVVVAFLSRFFALVEMGFFLLLHINHTMFRRSDSLIKDIAVAEEK